MSNSQVKANEAGSATKAEDDEDKKREILEKYGYKRSSTTTEPSTAGACGKTKRRTCC